jgi:uncharacterized membrane protein
VLHDRHDPKQFAIRVRLERTERYVRRNMSAPILGVMGVRAMNVIRIVGFVSVSLAVLVEPALAGVVGVPGPIAGIGLPALALIGGAYWIARKFFGRKR